MAGSPTGLIHVFLLCQFTASATSGAMKELVGAIGGSVTFPLTFTEKQIDSIVWSFNRTTLITIQPGTESKNATVIVTSNRNRERVDFSGGGYSLKLNKLRKNDSGSYSVQIHSSSSQFPSTQEYMLHVYESTERKEKKDTHQEISNFCSHSGENTEYDTVSYIAKTVPMEDLASTLYSTVQIPRKMENPNSPPTTPDTPRLFTYENVI
ncbi:SLAM family member 7 isoform X3 [Carlito syrichta]|uniref:SLAM family member 7 isoform X3 n=1 Tax=Carlito syrichta TaxID=1868482 RepID=A0A1U7TT77_CARSF|nr:SLAM family member 7 isoform X3 [Carlito syrichta]